MTDRGIDAQPLGPEKGLGPELRADLRKSWKGMIHWDVDMAPYCTFRTGGRAEALLEVADLPELAALMRWIRANGVKWRVIGRGSNVLVRSGGFHGILIMLGDGFRSIAVVDERPHIDETVRIRVGAGCSVARLIGWCARHAAAGLEFMVGIPGSLGGALRMNAGAWGGEIGSFVESVSLMDPAGELRDVAGEDLVFSYRQLSLRGDGAADVIVTEAVLRLKPGREKEIIGRCRDFIRRRREKQPLGVASGGSFFKNPPGDSAGRLIDEAGLKGLRRGDAMVSTRHANFIVNTGKATADEIVELMHEVQEKVYLHSGVMLEPEVQLL